MGVTDLSYCDHGQVKHISRYGNLAGELAIFPAAGEGVVRAVDPRLRGRRK